ncbi:MAG: HAMP domain-containing histidine kinase [Clostridia bacterium]|nr:HAMP domain-containing histidine kinase [Clostridia bacterium]
MFKSIFSRLTAIFIIIIVFSFTMIAFIITSLVGDYAISAKTETVSDTAESLSRVLELVLFEEDTDNSSYDINDMRSLLTASIFSKSINAFVVAPSGEVLFADTQSTALVENRTVEEGIMALASSETGYTAVSTLGGIFPDLRIINARSVKNADGVPVAAVFVYTDNHTETEMLSSLVRTLVLSTMWVLIAMLLAIYFVSERTIGPLKSMSRAAKQFASGKFDVRVRVSGSDELSKLSAAFNSMAESISNMEKMRSSFLGNVSHDLRTPMTTISGFIDGILDGTIPKEKHDYYLRIISGEVKRLSRLVSALLDISRIQAGERKFVPENFDICELGREILISFEKRIDEKRLDVSFECDRDSMIAFADRDAIHQVLYNLCDNAVKFSHEGGKLRMRFEGLDKRIHVSVYNEGNGISAEDLPFVFDRFYKTDKSRSLDKTGVGLGLYICRSVIEAHEENITVRSEEGKYCEFEFTVREGKEHRTKSFDAQMLKND